MNLVKHILAHVMRDLSHNPPTALRELRMRVHQIRNEIPKDSLERLYDGMTRRVDALMRTRGYSTKYKNVHLIILFTDKFKNN